MNYLKRLLKKCPFLYMRTQRLYYRILYLLEVHVLGTKLHEWVWKTSVHGCTSATYSDAVEHPHRAYLLEKLSKYYPFDSVLEVGCYSGPNLMLIAEKYPSVVVHGIDINSKSIDFGRRLIAEKELKNVTLQVSTADDLSLYEDKSIDIVFTDAALLYVGRDKIGDAIGEMVRVAKRAIIFNEWDSSICGKQLGSQWYDLHWIHNYSEQVKLHMVPQNITVSKIPNELWGAGGWQTYGAFIEVEL